MPPCPMGSEQLPTEAMLPRNPADYRSMLWALTMPVVFGLQLANPKLLPYLVPVSFYLAMAAGTMAHNHNHVPTFASKRMNGIYANWLSVFYGYPSFAWVPTHNLNHHKHVNREGDATITWRHTNRNTWYVAVSYFFVSAYYQSGPIQEYIRKAKENNPRLHRQIITQYVVWISSLVGTLALSIWLHPVWLGLKIWILAFGLPSFFGTWSMMWFNYMQHVHSDPWSKYDHSRNITGRVFNFLVFNNGLHTVHHANASAHWSTAYVEHAKIADKIHPALNQPSFWWWIVRGYVIPGFLPSLETKQIGRAPFDPPPGARAVARAGNAPVIDSVEALEAGNNAQIASV
jgi:beta-carotene hydroxylase